MHSFGVVRVAGTWRDPHHPTRPDPRALPLSIPKRSECFGCVGSAAPPPSRPATHVIPSRRPPDRSSGSYSDVKELVDAAFSSAWQTAARNPPPGTRARMAARKSSEDALTMLRTGTGYAVEVRADPTTPRRLLPSGLPPCSPPSPPSSLSQRSSASASLSPHLPSLHGFCCTPNPNLPAPHLKPWARLPVALRSSQPPAP
jgi:hypothetical protein